MTPMEIALLIIGVIIFVLSFFLPDTGIKKSEQQIEEEQEEIRRMMQKELDGMKLKVNEATSETVDVAVDKAERSLEKVSNEKIMAVSEYGETVIEEINKNHQEVMFLYDMLKDKHTDLTNSVREADAAQKEMETLSKTAHSASAVLQRDLNVISVTRKGLTDEQKAVFDRLDSTEPVATAKSSNLTYADNVTKSEPIEQIESIKTDIVASDIMPETKNNSPKVALDIMSGTVYQSDDSNAQMKPVITKAPAQPATEQSSQGNNNQKILELHKMGKSTVEIAKELKLGVGEVKLVIDLFN